jgi:hypothetical protein
MQVNQPQGGAVEANTPAADLRLVPFQPTLEQWSGLARAIVWWMRSYPSNKHTPATLAEHLSNLGLEIPVWMGDEAELRAKDHVISKGTVAVLIYKAMLAADSHQPQPVEGLEVVGYRCLNTGNLYRDPLAIMRPERVCRLADAQRRLAEQNAENAKLRAENVKLAELHQEAGEREDQLRARIAELEGVIRHTHDTIDGQLEIIAARAPGNWLDKKPMVNALKMHRARMRDALNAKPAEHGEGGAQ